jgi:alpha-galactosidase
LKSQMQRSGMVVWFIALLVCVPSAQVIGQTITTTRGELAATPPMGWNSWDSYGLTIDEAQFRANVEVQSTKLKRFGWTYSVIDEGWFLRNPQDRPHPELLQFELDSFGRYIPVPSRFPSALNAKGENEGFAGLGKWVHAQGLMFGIHIVRGIPRESVSRNLPVEGSSFRASDAADQTDACPWDPTNWGVKDDAAGQAWYDALLRQYAAWGVDFLKVDCIADHPYRISEIRQIHLAIKRSGRPMILSLSPGPTQLSHAVEVGSIAQMWRISDDVWDVWKSDNPFPRSVYSQFPVLAEWAQYARPGNWPDADMLPFGELAPKPDIGPGARHSRLTPEEQQSMLTLWSMARSPLILGANLTKLDEATMQLITNRSVLRIDQTATASRQVLIDGDLVAWTADLPGEEHALAVFNRGDVPLAVKKEFATFGLAAKTWHVENVWKPQPPSGAYRFEYVLAPHACVLLILK